MVWGLLQELDSYKSMGSDKIHLRLIRKLVRVLRLLSVVSEVVETGRKLVTTPSTKRAERRDQEIRDSSIFLLFLRKLWNESSGAITSQMKKMGGKSQQRSECA